MTRKSVLHSEFAIFVAALTCCTDLFSVSSLIGVGWSRVCLGRVCSGPGTEADKTKGIASSEREKTYSSLILHNTNHSSFRRTGLSYGSTRGSWWRSQSLEL